MKIGRNAPCPCGSGKKFKRCHGNQETQDLRTEYYKSVSDLPEELTPTYRELADAHPVLVEEIRTTDLQSCVSAAAALLLVASNQTRVPRIEALVYLAALNASGKQKPTVQQLDRWLNQYLADSVVAQIEDPPEDVAVGNVVSWNGNRRTFSGDWSNSDYYLQDIIDVLTTAPPEFQPLRDCCEQLLVLSDELARRFGYRRNHCGEPDNAHRVWVPATNNELELLQEIVHFDRLQLESLGISEANFAPLCTDLESLRLEAPDARPRDLRCRPMLTTDAGVVALFGHAISMALVNHAVGEISKHGQLRALAAHLWKIQAERSINRAATGISRKQDLTKDLAQSPISKKLATIAAFRFDISKCLHFILLHDDPFDISNNGLTANWQPDFVPTIGDYIEKSAKTLAEIGEYTGGLTIVVMGGLGRGCLLRTPKNLPPSWYLQVWAEPDLNRFMQFEDGWRLLLWKLSKQYQVVMASGTRMSIVHSDANLYSFWVSQGYRLIPAQLDVPPPFEFAIGPEFTHNLRRATRQGVDMHAIYRPDRKNWERVIKLHTRTYFKEEVNGPAVYASQGQVEHGLLEGAIETSCRSWWVDSKARFEDPQLRELIYQIWESTCNWVLRIAGSLEEEFQGLPNGNVIVDLDFTALREIAELTAEHVLNVKPPRPIGVSVNGTSIRLTFPVEFISLIAKPTNVAERMLVESLCQGVCMSANASLDRINAFIERLGMADDERHMHMFAAKEPRDYLAQYDRLEATFLQNVDLATVGLGIAREAGLRTGSRIDGATACNEALHAIVEACWHRIKESLLSINRRDLILQSVQNHERLLVDSDRWSRTSRALLSLHADKSDTVGTARRVREQRDVTQMATRVLIEMASCTCPLDGGRRFTQADSDYILAQIVQLMGTASRSDALRAGCIQPHITIAHNGEYTMGEDILGVMQNYLGAHFEQVYQENVRKYESFFEDSEEGTKTDVEVFGTDFVHAFQREYGISPQSLAHLGVVLTEDAIEAQHTVRTLSHQEFAELLKRSELNEEEAHSVDKNFVLHPRIRWDMAEKPFRNKDWWPWRFRRRLSMMSRPIVDVGDGTVIYAPAFCEDSFRHIVMEAYTGGCETEYYHSHPMKVFIGSINARRGLAFNKAVANKLHELGLRVRTEVTMKSLGADPSEAAGDIDVLAWNDRVVLVCECKELNFARTLGEVSEQLARFRGIANDDLHKHLRRVSWIKNNRDKLTDIDGNSKLPIRSLLVTSKTVPMQFIPHEHVEVMTIDALATKLEMGTDAGTTE
ncbi:MAG TPA: SEC-C domain-containing protein [Candidatus Nanopelagicaceae bacterium]|jgi:hypothetical protein